MDDRGMSKEELEASEASFENYQFGPMTGEELARLKELEAMKSTPESYREAFGIPEEGENG